MGSGSTISCNKCDYERMIFIGPGMSYYSIDGVLNPLDNEYKSIFSMRDSLRDRYKDVKEILSEEVYICNNCGFWDNKTLVKFEVEDFTLSYKHRCPKCKSKLDESTIEEVIGYIKCPKYDSENLNIENNTLLWD